MDGPELPGGWTRTPKIFKKLLDDEDFNGFVRDLYMRKVYEQLRDAAEPLVLSA